MAQTSNPHRGFDYATTVPGEAVPTTHDRGLARELSRMAVVHTVGWSGTRERIVVTTESLAPVLLAVAREFEGRHAEFEVTSDNSHEAGFKVEVAINR